MTRDSRCFGFSKRPSSENGSNHTSESREHVVMTTGPAWIGAITIDCDDAAAMRSIYKEALGGVDISGFDQSIRVGGRH